MKLKLKKQNDRYGYVDEDGNWAIEPGFLCAEEFDGGLAIVRPSGLYGYLKEDGSWLIEPTLHYASPFEGEIARVMKRLVLGADESARRMGCGAYPYPCPLKETAD